ncbi:PorV/PorQ family protein [bacterium]|nr:PorV/PorQ family protein [bacterium]
MKKLCFLVSLFLLWQTTVYAGNNEGTAGAAFLLKLPSSAKAIGMGGAYSALAKDANSLFINPAGLSFVKQHSFSTTYIGWVEGIGTGFISYAFPSALAKGTLSGSLLYASSGKVEGRDNSGILTGDIYAKGGVAALSYGRAINEQLSLGSNLKFIWEKLDEESGLATALDLGLLFEPTERLSLGVALKNIGSKIKIDEEGDKLPFSAQAGLAYRIKDILTLACDIDQALDSSLQVHTGVEYWYKDKVAFRAGYNQAESELGAPAGLTLGTSFKAASKTRGKSGLLSILGCLSYAYFSLGDLEDCHIISYEADF